MNWQKIWQEKGVINYLLLPLSFVFFCLVNTRKLLYKLKILRTNRAELPVIVVGNINVGGAGKTPLVIALGMLLKENNIKFAAISKGYGGDYKDFKIVSKDSKAKEVGDEPLLIKLKLNCPVVVGKNRLESIKIVKDNFPEIDVVLTDDGLQDYSLERDLEIVVVNYKQKLGNKFLLPAGPLRDLSSRLSEADLVIVNGENDCNLSEYSYKLIAKKWININSNESMVPNKNDMLEKFKKNNILALSGIAIPDNFFNKIADMGIEFRTKSYKDHHNYTGEELEADKTILMTEKDWVKVKEFKHSDAWYLSVCAELDANFKNAVLKKINNIILGN